MLKAGTYFGRIVDSGTATSKEKKTPYLWVEFAIDHVWEGDGWVPCEPGLKRDINFWLSDKAWDVSMGQLKRLNFNGNIEKPAFNMPDGVALECFHEIYNDRPQERWQLSYTKERVQLDRSDLRALQARIAQEFKQAPAGPPPPAPQGVPGGVQCQVFSARVEHCAADTEHSRSVTVRSVSLEQ